MSGFGITPPQPETTPLANMKKMDDDSGIMLWYGDRALGAIKSLIGYIPLPDLQLITLQYSVTKAGFEAKGPNLFSDELNLYSVEGQAIWITDLMENKPVKFTRKPKNTTPSSGFNMPVFRPSSTPSI